MRIIAIAEMLRFDMTAARAHGDVVYLFAGQHDVSPMMGQRAVDLMHDRLAAVGYDPREDAIALTGPVALVAMLLVAAVAYGRDGIVPVMVFDARGGSYKMRDLALPATRTQR